MQSLSCPVIGGGTPRSGQLTLPTGMATPLSPPFMHMFPVSCCRYHAKLPLSERVAAHRDFQRNDASVMVASLAFGMGIDKPNIRRIIHYVSLACMRPSLNACPYSRAAALLTMIELQL